MTPSTLPPLPAAELELLDQHFPERTLALAHGRQAVREAGAADAPALVCLHGIGSGAASWLGVARTLAPQARLIAWDAPGYGVSSPLLASAPRAADYAARLAELLQALDIRRCVLVGHSLGALVAGAAARPDSALRERIARLVLVSPARGYGGAGREPQARQVRTQRLAALAEGGIAGMAGQRADRLLSADADATARQWVRWNMGRLNEGGYRQAIELLCGDDLLAALPPAMPVRVLCGAEDVVTPPAACRDVAAACGVGLEELPGAGHACYVEQPGTVARALLQELHKATA
ncbi:alpha/beta fold hydrolase [Pseudorhodoferax sp. Leaf274]|uniref:alpha/beta fold hydrolase n=1 Tax=Pseudorhodoferax sp. Leaf274 TaxID=1736318 RepID=UPI0007029CB7|nr:alpha/beta fold hydrolase [Pseudorhodoferax sp. Leaf274]KQP44216.1 hydrolase [Pseudorhodoferax sp. Leaf274]